jgi:hydrogenase maturation protein HypF
MISMVGVLSPADRLVRCRARVRGQVQGVGFRPFVHALAGELALTGWVRNDGGGVELEVQGPGTRVESFVHRLAIQAPPLARVDQVEARDADLLPGEEGFAIVASLAGAVATGVTPDAAVCPACLAELFDRTDRRYRYPFINCTHCGPRYTLTSGLPYDRANTSMASFVQCPPCEAEYSDPSHRRFHAQPNACPECGPRLRLLDGGGEELPGADVVAGAVARLAAGEILAVKGLGGFHLMCDATDAAAVARLRERKNREEKPLAVMAANAESLAAWAEVGAAERELLEGRERPVVLLRKRSGGGDPLPGVAPGIAWLGAMLPYTPLHYLLFHEALGRPPGSHWIEKGAHPPLFVCTSANPGGEPLVTGDQEAVVRLGGLADALVAHDREILVRCDDSVVRRGPAGATFLRRGRGYTPAAIRLPRSGPAVLATGPWLKNAACLTRGDEAFLTQHVGDLENAATCRALDETVEHLLSVLRVEPERVACDLHPDFYSTHLAGRLAQQWNVPLVQVQHHHAHLAAVAAEHHLEGPILGLALDGVGLGTDGTAWGGEMLLVEGAGFQRLGHLHPLLLPGGDRAAQEPWRMAAAALHALGRQEEIPRRFAAFPLAAGVAEMLKRGVGCPPTTSLGRLFDAAAGLLGIKPVARFEGQAPMLLEGLAEAHGPVAPLAGGWRVEGGILDLRPLLAALAEMTEPAAPPRAAALFHATVAAALAAWLGEAAREQGVTDLALGGGCCLNQVLMGDLRCRLEGEGFAVYEARRAPPNDGGLALGQAWVALQSPLRPIPQANR